MLRLRPLATRRGRAKLARFKASGYTAAVVVPAFARSLIAPFTLAAAALVLGCPAKDDGGASGLTVRTCGVDVWYRATSREARVELVGSWDGFARPGRAVIAERDDGWRHVHVDAAPGPYRYALIDDGVWLTDPLVGTTAWEGEREVSYVEAPSCDAPALAVSDVAKNDDTGRAIVRVSLAAAANGPAPLDARSITVTTRAGAPVAPKEVTSRSPSVVDLTFDALPRGKHVFVIGARDAAGRAAEPARASIWMGWAPEKRDTTIYQIVIDRFEGAAGPLAPPSEPGGRAGGTLAGVTRAIERGDFEALGISTLWLSPVYKNPDGFFPGGEGRRFTGYHGYWPVDTRAIDPALGDEAALDALVGAAHARGLRVILDVVPNHVHVDDPWWKTRANDDDFNAPDGKCLCGTDACPWDTSIEKCWFAPYLPDLNTRREPVLTRVVDDVAFWLDRFELDGLRIDAVPMMPRSTTRRIAARARARFEHPGHPLYLVGETFTAANGFDALRYNLGPMALDGQFHFPLMWALRASIAQESAPLSVVDGAIAEGEDAFRGSGAVMATMIGNHDVTRFASESDGSAKGDGYAEPAPPPRDALVYAKQKTALGVIFTLPGAPVVYYGDELALPGRLDPDSRRVMPSEGSLTDDQKDVRAFTRRIGRLRAACPALRSDTYAKLDADAESWAFARGGDPATGSADARALVVVARRPSAQSRTVAVGPRIRPGRYVEALTGEALTVPEDGLTSLALPPFSVRVFLPEGDPCLPPR